MAANYVLLETITVGEATASSVTFNNIPQTGYTDLKIVMSFKSTNSAAVDGQIAFNGTNANIKWLNCQGNGSTTASGSNTAVNALGQVAGSSYTGFNNNELYLPNYTSSNYKPFSVEYVSENNATTAFSGIITGLNSSSAAITSATISCSAGNLAQYSTFSLYGLAAVGTTPVIAPYASGGDIIQTDGTYWYHAFLSSGTFTPAKGLSCDYLVVAGGAGGGGAFGGGGGAGGFKTSIGGSALSVTATSYAISVGAGGAGGVATYQGTNGSNSVFSTVTSTGGGGGGGAYSNAYGLNGGSGGGGTVYTGSVTTTKGFASPTGQGNDGGNAGYGGGGNVVGGGGGGAGAVGGNATTTVGGTGGNGTYNALTDAFGTLTGIGQLSSTHYYYAAGGGGGANSGYGSGASGGIGGGGTGTTSTGGDATPNLGAGGGGSGGGGVNGGKGGSGIVIVRYAI